MGDAPALGTQVCVMVGHRLLVRAEELRWWDGNITRQEPNELRLGASHEHPGPESENPALAAAVAWPATMPWAHHEVEDVVLVLEVIREEFVWVELRDLVNHNIKAVMADVENEGKPGQLS